MRYEREQAYDVAVIGAGHAGIEAALAAARLGAKTILFTINLDAVGNMPCNPSIGGTAKSHLVKEIDALGGEMGRAADHNALQERTLNRGKGPAVHALRMQIDRRAYQSYMKQVLEHTPGLDLRQAEIVDIGVDETGRVCSVTTHLGAVYRVGAVILATGTYLGGRVIIGDVAYQSGPDGMFAALQLTPCLQKLGVKLMRFKTGTPARVHADSLDFSVMEEQKGDEPPEAMSFDPDVRVRNILSCHITYTNPHTHEIILANLDRAPMYTGVIEGVGPRYCPSIEDKVVRFRDKERHQLFIEPTGAQTKEMYVQGMSTSLPEDVQEAFLSTIRGMEKMKIMRPGYAIEYDCADPTQLYASLEFKKIPGLYGAGQFNGTSGYEEAAAQGLIAGINAARQVKGQTPLILERTSSYIGTLIDDLVVKGTREPYRMMTSRSEYRLMLRQDNADERLMPLGYEIGLVDKSRYERYLARISSIRREVARLEHSGVTASTALNDMLIGRGSTPLAGSARLADLLRRPQISYQDLAPFDKQRPPLADQLAFRVEIEIKYAGYVKKQLAQVEQVKKLERKKLPPDLDYAAIHGLRLETRQKLAAAKPDNLGMAARISGVSPADISVLIVYLAQREKQKDTEKPQTAASAMDEGKI